jgi:hypothetical protein
MLLDFKEAAGIVNSATAFLAIIEIVKHWLEEHAAEADEADAAQN